MELYQCHGKHGYEYMLICTLKQKRQCFLGLSSWPTSSQGHAGSPWHKSKNHLIRPIWQFLATKLWDNYFLPLHYFFLSKSLLDLTTFWSSGLSGVWSSLCNIRLDSLRYFNVPDNVFYRFLSNRAHNLSWLFSLWLVLTSHAEVPVYIYFSCCINLIIWSIY